MNLFEFFSVPSVEKHEQENPTKQDDDQQRQKLANDLYWYILDHDHFHKKHVMPIAQGMDREYQKTKKLDRSKYSECWMPLVREACLEFHEKHKMPGNPKKVFDEEICKHLCKRLADRYIEDIKKGEYKLG
jgi:hypothetical protein